MTTERFTRQEFEDAVDNALEDLEEYEGQYYHMHPYRSFDGTEERYYIPVQTFKNGMEIRVQINSSMHNGIADDSGDNSIRLWITDQDGKPWGNKVGRWITRQPGWQNRLDDKLNILLGMAESVQWCDKCRSVEKVFIVKKDGPNKGRIFVKCNCKNSFTWLDIDADEEEVKPVKAEASSPKCPKCGGMMAKRTRKSDGHPFWGCRLYPACNGTVDIQEEQDGVETPKGNNSSAGAENFAEAPLDGKKAILQARSADKPKKFDPSPQQLEVFTWTKNVISKKAEMIRALVVEAVAGSGKTTTGVEMLKYIPRNLSIVYVAFNKHIVAALRDRVPKGFKVSTYNSLGFAACRKAYGPDMMLDVDAGYSKIDKILEDMLDKYTNGYMFPAIKKLVGLVKADLCGTSDEELDELCERHDVDVDGDRDTIFAAVSLTIMRDAEMTNVIDYDDQVWLPVFHNLPMTKYDGLVVDEFQDTNKCNLALALKSLKDDGIIIAVGDRHQSLYGFRGADVNAIPNFIETLEADVLPLSVTFRNPKCVVRLVNEKFPEIAFQAADWAIEGEIREISEERSLMEYAPGDMVLCRTNAPLVKPAFALIRRGVKAIIRGRDIGKGLTILVRKMKARDMSDLIAKLTEYQEKEIAKLIDANKNSQAQAVTDKVETIIALADGIFSISELETRIDLIFSDKSEGVVFSSVHRAKGLEAKRVYILHRELMPHPMAKKEWELIQESNIEYVAYTRALEELIFVD